MASKQEREELDARARQGETLVPGGTGGKSLVAQEHLAEGIYKFYLFISPLYANYSVRPISSLFRMECDLFDMR